MGTDIFLWVLVGWCSFMAWFIGISKLEGIQWVWGVIGFKAIPTYLAFVGLLMILWRQGFIINVG